VRGAAASPVTVTGESVRKTRAKPGALTGTLQVLAPVSQVIVTMLSSPFGRPSTSNLFPNV